MSIERIKQHIQNYVMEDVHRLKSGEFPIDCVSIAELGLCSYQTTPDYLTPELVVAATIVNQEPDTAWGNGLIMGKVLFRTALNNDIAFSPHIVEEYIKEEHDPRYQRFNDLYSSYDPVNLHTAIDTTSSLLDKVIGQDHWFLQNGASLYLRLLPEEVLRIPTDLDIVVKDCDLMSLREELEDLGLCTDYEETGPVIWGYHYKAPQLRTQIAGLNVDIITETEMIHQATGRRYYSDYRGINPERFILGSHQVNLAPLDLVYKNKLFQQRPWPKQDLLDLSLIAYLQNK